jgi:hypothetical protein
MSPQTMQYLLPLLIIVPILLLRARRMSRPQPLKLGLLWVRPAILVVLCVVALTVRQPGVPVRHFAAQDWAALAAAALLGVIAGWYSARSMNIEVHPENGTLMVKGGPLALLIMLGLLLARMALRAGTRLEAQAWHLDVVLIFDALIVFTVALFVARAAEMFIRARALMAGRG